MKYRPSYFLGEEVNIGLLFFFQEEQHFSFVYPNKLSRLTNFYPDTNLPLIRSYLKGFQQKVKQLAIPTTLSRETLEQLLLEDATNLYFSPIKSGQYNTIDQTLNYYIKSYFYVYEHQHKFERKDEKYLNDKIVQQIAQYQSIAKLFRKNYVLENALQKTKFDFAWKNGTVNLIKSISFDLKESDSIQNKSFRWFGELTKLAPKAQKEQLSFDLFIAKPQRKQLFKTYDNALRILNDIESPKRIIEEETLPNYIENAARSIQAHDWSLLS
ncbi:MAG: DUF3037 domain-containing protein [Flammeovirgaceae bacterium]